MAASVKIARSQIRRFHHLSATRLLLQYQGGLVGHKGPPFFSIQRLLWDDFEAVDAEVPNDTDNVVERSLMQRTSQPSQHCLGWLAITPLPDVRGLRFN
jgi:hypothetical protein